MNSPENLPISTVDFYKHAGRVTAEMTEITAIYNRHSDEQDARKTVALIDSDSIVYIEAFGAEIPSAEDIELALTSYEGLAQMLGSYRRQHGKGERYQELKQEILEVIRTADITNTPRGLTFLEHKKELLRLLIEKDCIVVVADYDHFTSEPDSQQMVDNLTLRMESGLERNRFSIYDEIMENEGTLRYFKQLCQMTYDKNYLHTIREKFAAVEIVADLYSAAEKSYTNLPRTPEGKIKAYVCYGTAHSRSLTKKLEHAGMTVKNVEVESLSEPEYFDQSGELFRGNILRRVGMEAYLGLMQNVYNVDFVRNQELLTVMYSGMETLNTNPHEALDFCVRCIKIYQKSLDPDNDIENDLDQLHRPYIGSNGEWLAGLNMGEY